MGDSEKTETLRRDRHDCRGDTENEMAQIIGAIKYGKDLGEKHFLFMGCTGILVVGPKCYLYDAFLVPFCCLQGMMMVAGQVQFHILVTVLALDQISAARHPMKDLYCELADVVAYDVGEK